MHNHTPTTMAKEPARKSRVMGSRQIINPASAPMKGAVEKYAPVRAVPSARRANTNNTRLRPYPKKPTTSAAAIKAPAGRKLPSQMPRTKLTTPPTRPLTAATCIGSPAETFCVRLLSIAQQRQAPTTASGPTISPLAKYPCHEMNTPPTKIPPIPSTNLRPKFS